MYETRTPPKQVNFHELRLGTLEIGLSRFIPAADLQIDGKFSTRKFGPLVRYYARKAGIKVQVKKSADGAYVTRIR